MTPARQIRLGADIGGTFTDVALDVEGRIHSTKVLTNYTAPEQAILDGIEIVLAETGVRPSALDIVIHGTTLATNALIARRGARTAFVTTEGFRDVIEMRTENRFDHYDLGLRLPLPLVPREHRFPIRGRIGARGQELKPLDTEALERLADVLTADEFESIAIGFIHSYANPSHEHKAREILGRRVKAPISISSEVSPQMREYERFNTVCANAYVQPLMAAYLARLETRLRDMDVRCPVLLIHSGGGLVSVNTAATFPVRLVESGPAGGAILAADVAQRFGLNQVVSYDMGGTTAKICLIQNSRPRTARTFEVARTHRFCKGSGMPISIPVIEMIEIGAGGGSIASIDAMGRIQTGPESAGSEPGPACYQRGGVHATISDADLLLGKIDPENFAGGAIRLSVSKAQQAMDLNIGAPLGLAVTAAAFGVAEVVDENMANAARVHAVENGKDIASNVMIAFGGAAPLHAARLCEKLGIDRCLIPEGAGVGSAIGFLKAPFSYEAVGSYVTALSELDTVAVNALLAGLRRTAEEFARSGSSHTLRTEITAFMRYSGQGWEIPVPLPDQVFSPADARMIHEAFEESYARFFGRAIDRENGLGIEIVTWSVKVQEDRPLAKRIDLMVSGEAVTASQRREVFDAATGSMRASAIVARESLACGQKVAGPAVIVERETSTVVTAGFDAVLQPDGSILLVRNGSGK